MLRLPFIILFLTLVFYSNAQQDSNRIQYDSSLVSPVEITKNDLATYYADDKFDYEVEKVDYSWWEGVKNWFYNVLRSFFEFVFGEYNAPNYLSVFLEIVPYLLLALLLYLLIRFFINANTKNIIFSKENPNLVSLSEEERLIKTEDIQGLIKQAFDDKNYRLAIRYYYLFLLKLLTERELIDWQLQKTNDDYIIELAKSNLLPQFKKVTILYDYIWYGEFTIDEAAYQSAKSNFDKLKNAISTDV